MLRTTGLGRHIGDAWIWRDVNVQLRAGDNLAILGPTGAGKSLLLRCLAGLDKADEGTIELDDRLLDEWRMPSYRARVVYLHQRPALWEGTVEDNLRAVFKLAAHRARGFDRPRALRLLAAFDRDETFLGKATGELSGGEAEIGALIRALQVEPTVLLLDEPSASMDAAATRQAEALLEQWVDGAPNRATVWTSHDVEQVRRVADRTVTLGGGSGGDHVNGYLQIGYGQTALAGGLIIANLALSAALSLGPGRRLLVASLRMSAQLLLVGLVLEWVFALDNPLPVLMMAAAMTAMAGVAAVNRTRRRFAGAYWSSLVSVSGSSFFVTGLALVGILRVDPWFEPQYLIPLLGMVLGNTLNGISLALDRFVESLAQRRDAVEALLALGATRWEAAHEHVREAMRVGLIPTINSMMVMGIVSLPGMMTGQILAGAEPADAVRYQIVIMFMIASAAALGAFGVVLFAYHALFDHDHRLRLDRVRRVDV